MSRDNPWRRTADALDAARHSAPPPLRPECAALHYELSAAGERYDAAQLARDGAPPAAEVEAFDRAHWIMDYAATFVPSNARNVPGTVRWEPGPPTVYAHASLSSSACGVESQLVSVSMRVPGSIGEGWRVVLETHVADDVVMRPVLVPPWQSEALTRHGAAAASDLATIAPEGDIPQPFGTRNGISCTTQGAAGGASEALLWRWRHLRAAVVAAVCASSPDVQRRAHDAIRRADDAARTLAEFRGLDASEFPRAAGVQSKSARARIARPTGDVDALAAEVSQLVAAASDLLALAAFRAER